MRCAYFDAGVCRSCTWMGRPHGEQVADKERHCADLLGERDDLVWLPPVAGRESGYRNKAKMVVSGTVEHPTLGHPRRRRPAASTCRTAACTRRSLAAASRCSRRSSRARASRRTTSRRARGELKYLLVTQSPDGELMVRFVLRSQEPVARIRKHLPWLLDALPQLRVASVNLQPDHKAVLEGDREILLTGDETLRMRVNGIDLHLRPQSFFQTNTEVAAALYRHAASWVEELAPRSVWDLYCGVGGFALHVAAPGREVVGHRDQRRGGRERDAERRRPRAWPACGSPRATPRRSPLGAGGARPGDRQPAAAGDRRGAEPLAGGLRRAARPLLQLQRRLARPRPRAPCRRCGRVRAQLLDMFPQTTALRGAHTSRAHLTLLDGRP